MKKIIIILAISGIAGFAVYQALIKNGGGQLDLHEIKKADVFAEVSETGQIQSGEKINLDFKNAGPLEKIYVKVGDSVRAGQLLAKLDASQLEIELQEAKASLEIAQAKLDQLLAGSTQEEIKIAKTALSTAQQNLQDVKADAQEDLQQVYQDALNDLDSAYATVSGTYTEVDYIQKEYFIYNDQESITVRTNRDGIKQALREMKDSMKDAKAEEASNQLTEEALEKFESSLNQIYDWVVEIKEATQVNKYQSLVTNTDRSALDAEMASLNTESASIVDSRQNISLTKITNRKNINAAESALREAEAKLELKEAGPRQEDINLYRAQVKQARSKVDLLENKIQDSSLLSPLKGQVAEINKKAGETVKAAESEPAMILIPSEPYQIKADIYEEDVVKIEIGDPVEIFLVALPEETFKGKVLSVNPAEKIVEEVVYYEVTVSIEEAPKSLKPGMTADIYIRTDFKEGILAVPEDAVFERNKVEVFKDGRKETRELELGLEGANDLIEVISGISEGESVVLR